MEFGRRSERMNEMIGQLELSLEEIEGKRIEARPLPSRRLPKSLHKPILSPCPPIFPANLSSIGPIRPAVRSVAANSNGWERKSANNSNTFRIASG
jgi:hypothetical protein